jgi:phage gpG-like protein
MIDNRAGIDALHTVAKAVRGLARVPSQAAAGAAEEIAALIQQEFDAGRDPYGDAWADLMPATLDKGRSPPPLTDDGDLRDVDVRAQVGAGIAIELGEPYGAFHQIGTRTMKARPILPVHGLPDTWRRAIADEVDRAFLRAAP